MDFIFDPGLVLYLPLYELDGASFMSKDACGHLCTVTGALWRPNGRYFDGLDDDINCGNNSSLDLTSAMSIDIWVNLNNQNDRSIAAKFEYVAGKRQWILQLDTKVCRLLIRNATDDGYLSAVGSNSEMDASVWQHWGITWDGSNIRYYKNSVADGTPAASGTGISTASVVRLGRYTAQATYFAGYIGEIRIYNRALTHQEIQHNYLATKWRYR